MSEEILEALRAIALEAKKTNALLRLVAEQSGVEYWRVGDALEEAEQEDEKPA